MRLWHSVFMKSVPKTPSLVIDVEDGGSFRFAEGSSDDATEISLFPARPGKICLPPTTRSAQVKLNLC